MHHLLDSLRDAIVAMRAAVRQSRDARGDERCWVDDRRIHATLPGAPPDPQTIPVDAMARCEAFYRHRRANEPDPFPEEINLDRESWNEDLDAMGGEALMEETARLIAAIEVHQAVPDLERTIDDDRALYAVLPEKIRADFRLPPEPEFLGEALAPRAGCPAFWRSHAACTAPCHDLHRWGPCKPA